MFSWGLSLPRQGKHSAKLSFTLLVGALCPNPQVSLACGEGVFVVSGGDYERYGKV